MGKLTYQNKIDIITDYQKLLTVKELAEKYSCSRQSISNLLTQHNIERHPKKALTTEQKNNIIDEYKNGKSTTELMGQYKFSRNAINRLLKLNDVEIRQYRKYKFDFNIFNNIDTEEKSYWMGFLLGDGSVSRGSLNLKLKNIDLGHLIKYKIFTKADNPILPTPKGQSIISIYNTNFISTIAQYGLVPNKTYEDIRTPNQIPNHFLHHFYRGILDADGCVKESKSKSKNGKIYKSGFCFSICSYNYDFLLEIQKWMCDKLGEKRGCLQEVTTINPPQRRCNLTFCGRSLFSKVYHIFYDDAAIYLDRKKQKADSFMNRIEYQEI